MKQEENKELHTAGREDLFTRMMFGGSHHVQQQGEQEDDGWINSHDKGFENKNEKITSIDHHLQDLLANVNIEELIKNIDTIKTSASQFKPLLTKLSPLINKWIK